MIGKEDVLLEHVEAAHLQDKMDHEVCARSKDEKLEIISGSRLEES